MSTEDQQIDRINELSAVARTSWLALLGYLAYIGITLLAVEDADFFVETRRTDLPIVGISIPTYSFFIFAPPLAAALFAYLHVHLLRLWDALGEAPATVGGEPLGDRIHPWLANDFMLALRRDGAIRPRPLRLLSGFASLSLVWLATPLVLGGFWWRSMPAHDEGLTFWIGGWLLLALWVAANSWWRARRAAKRPWLRPWRGWWPRPLAALVVLLVVVVGWARTEGGAEHWAYRLVDLADATLRTQPDPAIETRLLRRCYPHEFAAGAEGPPSPDCFDSHGVELPREMVQERRIAATWWIPPDNHRGVQAIRAALARWLDEEWTPLARTRLAGEDLVPLPPDWRDADVAARTFREDWCAAEGLPMTVWDHLPGPDRERPAHVVAGREAYCGANRIATADCEPRFAALDARFERDWEAERGSARANLAGFDVAGRDLRGSDAGAASLVGADLVGARLEGANLFRARLEGANLFRARLEGADLSGARLEEANLGGARLEGANLVQARLEGARLEGADLSGARLEGANLGGARLEGANLRYADFRNSNWAGASNRSSPAQFADFRTGQELSQAQLEDLIGNDGTLLPDRPNKAGEDYYVWSCWETPPEGFDATIEAAAGRFADDADRAALRAEFLCGPDNPRRKVGTPLALDAPYPDGHPLADRD